MSVYRLFMIKKKYIIIIIIKRGPCAQSVPIVLNVDNVIISIHRDFWKNHETKEAFNVTSYNIWQIMFGQWKKTYRSLKLAVSDMHIKCNECRHWTGKGSCKTQGVWSAVYYICLLLIHVILQDVHFLWWEKRDIYRRNAGYALLEKLPHA